MKEFAFTVNLKKDDKLIDEYKKHHLNVWSEVKNALKKIGITEMKIFLNGTTLFMHLKTEDKFDPILSFENYHTLDLKIKEWELLMNSFKKRKAQWLLMDEIFDLK